MPRRTLAQPHLPQYFDPSTYAQQFSLRKFSPFVLVAAALSIAAAILFESWLLLILGVSLAFVGALTMTLKFVNLKAGYFYRRMRFQDDFVGFVGNPQDNRFEHVWFFDHIEPEPYWMFSRTILLDFADMKGLFGSQLGHKIEMNGYLILQFNPILTHSSVKSLFLNRESPEEIEARLRLYATSVITEVLQRKFISPTRNIVDFAEQLYSADFQHELRTTIKHCFYNLEGKPAAIGGSLNPYGLVFGVDAVRSELERILTEKQARGAGTALSANEIFRMADQQAIEVSMVAEAVGAQNARSRIIKHSSDRTQTTPTRKPEKQGRHAETNSSESVHTPEIPPERLTAALDRLEGDHKRKPDIHAPDEAMAIDIVALLKAAKQRANQNNTKGEQT